MNKYPFLNILVPNYLSFYQQGQSLAAGFNKLGYKADTITVRRERKEEAYRKIKGEIVISVGSWRDWPWICREPLKRKKKVFPWFVSDDKVLSFVNEINQCPILFTTSEFCKRIFEKAGVKGRIIQVIPEGTDTDFWKPILKKETERIKSIIPLIENEKRVILLTIGRDGTSKGAQEVLKAFKKIPFLNIFYLIKTMDSEDAFFEGLKEKKIIKNSPLKSKVKYIIGHFSDEFIRILINLCDIYAAPSRHEGFGLPHIQAMACQKPVITCRGTAAEETSLNGITGYIVSSSPMNKKDAEGYSVKGVKANIEELKEAIKKLVENEKLRESMGKKARKHIVKNYECKKVAQLFLKKIKQFV